jgi:hypothetical protein
MRIATVINAHENSPVFKDTLESVIHYLTDNVLVVVDGKGWDQFRNDDSMPALKLEGFYHGKESAPYRNMCLGLMKAWETWGSSVDWYCYMEYDALVGSGEIREHLKMADELGFWLLGNDHRTEEKTIPFLDNFQKEKLNLHYFLGCCLFFSLKFMETLDEKDFFRQFLNFTNFHCGSISLVDAGGKSHMVYDVSEFLYPTLAIHYGGSVGEIACWEGGGWRGNYEHYPMRFRPDLSENIFSRACVLHPLKDYENPVRKYHREKRIESLRCRQSCDQHGR